MRICLIGGTGFIGSHIIDSVRKQSEHLIVFSRSAEKFRAEFDDVTYIYDDLANVEAHKELLFDGIDVVIHLASKATPQLSNQDILYDINSNLVETIKLLDVCVEMNVPRFIFLSTGGAVYGIPQTIPITEAHPTHPLSSYGIVKLSIEKYLALYHRLYGLNYYILRPANPYGARQDPFRKHGIIAVYLWKVFNGQAVVKFGEGNTIRDYLHVTDLVQAIYSLCQYQGQERLFNVGSGIGVSINQLIESISLVTGKPIQVEQLPQRKSDVPSVVLDSSLLRQELGWHCHISLEEGIEQTANWISKIRNGYYQS